MSDFQHARMMKCPECGTPYLSCEGYECGCWDEEKEANVCDLCGTQEERQRERENLLSEAESLRDFAAKLSMLAHGHIKPHTDDVKNMGASARHIIRYLASEWM